MPPIKSYLPTGAKLLDLEVARLRKSYTHSPVTIDGIIGEGAQSTVPARTFGGGYQVHLFPFVAWKIEGGEVCTGELILARAVPNAAAFPVQLAPYSYQRVSALLSAETTRAIVVDGLETGQCPADLAAAAQRLTVPVVIAHPRLGTLTLDRGLQLFVGNPLWNGSVVALSLPAAGETIEPAVLKRAEEIILAERALDERLLRFLLASVVDELAADQPGVEAQAATITLQGLHFSPSGVVAFWYNDGGLWGEHALVVRLHPNGEMAFSVEG